jgi:hypothetical protein
MAEMLTTKKMYEQLTTEPAKASMAHTTKAMSMASKMGKPPEEKKMAKGGTASSRADGCVQRGKTRGKMV